MEQTERNDRVLEKARLSNEYDELSSKGICNLTKDEHKRLQKISKELEKLGKECQGCGRHRCKRNILALPKL